MFEGPPKALKTDHLVAPKAPKEFEEEAKWRSDAADDEAARRKLQGERRNAMHSSTSGTATAVTTRCV
jgi:hypothetical protein